MPDTADPTIADKIKCVWHNDMGPNPIPANMKLDNMGAIVRLKMDGKRLSIHLVCNPGPFPFGVPENLCKAQYIGTCHHLVLTLMADRDLVGLLGFQADVPRTPAGQEIRWLGGAVLQKWQEPGWECPDLFYHLSTLFIRDVKQLMAGQWELRLAARVTGINGVLSNRQYWLVEIPALSREVLLNIDEIVLVRRRKVYEPENAIRSKEARGPFWQLGVFADEPNTPQLRDLRHSPNKS